MNRIVPVVNLKSTRIMLCTIGSREEEEAYDIFSSKAYLHYFTAHLLIGNTCTQSLDKNCGWDLVYKKGDDKNTTGALNLRVFL